MTKFGQVTCCFCLCRHQDMPIITWPNTENRLVLSWSLFECKENWAFFVSSKDLEMRVKRSVRWTTLSDIIFPIFDFLQKVSLPFLKTCHSFNWFEKNDCTFLCLKKNEVWYFHRNLHAMRDLQHKNHNTQCFPLECPSVHPESSVLLIRQ